jgi:hypothetical protein
MRLPLREVAARYRRRRLQEGEPRRHPVGLQTALFRDGVQADLAQEEARIVGGGDRGDMDPGVSLSR